MSDGGESVRVRFGDGAALRRICDAVRDLAPQVTLDFEPVYGCPHKGRVYVQATDASHVCLVAVDVTVQGSVKRPTSIGVDLNTLHRALRFMAPDDCVELAVSGGAARLRVDIFPRVPPESANRSAHFDITLLQLDGGRLSIPDQPYDARVRMPSAEYARVFKELATLGSEVKLECSAATGFVVTAAGSLGTASIVFREDEDLKIDVRNDVCVRLSMRYMASFAKACALAPTASLGLMRDSPAVVEFEVASMAGSLSFYLAPRIVDGGESPSSGSGCEDD